MKTFLEWINEARFRRGGKRMDPRIAYNKAVLSHLQQISPEHADALNSHGSTLGWWDSINFFRTNTRMTPEEAAEKLAQKPLEQQ